METASRPRLLKPAAANGSQFPLAAAILEPFNPYALPVDRTAGGWARWAVQALVLSFVATIIWDHGTSIRPEVKGQVVLAAPAQWVSALVLGVGLLVTAAALGLPWGILPVAAAAVVLTRRALAAIGEELTLDGALDRVVGKAVMAMGGAGAWWASSALAGWVQSLTSSLTSNPVARIAAGEEATTSIKAQASTAAEAIASAGALAGAGLVLIAAIWWGVALWMRTAEKSETATAEETADV